MKKFELLDEIVSKEKLDEKKLEIFENIYQQVNTKYTHFTPIARNHLISMFTRDSIDVYLYALNNRALYLMNEECVPKEQLIGNLELFDVKITL